MLEELPGIGPGQAARAARELGSLRAVREAPLERLAAVPGISPRDAQTIAGFFAAIRGGSSPGAGESGFPDGSPGSP